MTALTLNGSAVAATTLAAAGKLFNATGGTSGNTSTKVGSGTLFKQIFALGTATNQTGVASIPAPTDSNFNGWMWDVTTLQGQLLQAGTLTPTIHLLASTGTTMTPTVQWFKRTSGGVYTQLATVQGSSLALTTSSQALTFTPPSMSDTAFATGDKLVMWLWVNQTAGGATNSTISVVEATSASSAGVTSEAQTVTQGFIPIVTTTYSFTEQLIASTNKPSTAYSTGITNNGPLAYYRLGESSGPTIADSSGNGFNGTASGTITYNQVGAIVQDLNGAVSLDGSTASIQLPHALSTNGATALTIETWILPSATAPGFGRVAASDDVNNNLKGWQLGIGTNAASGFFAIGNGTTKFEVDYNTAFSTTTYTQFVGVWDGSNLYIYINGAQAAGPVTAAVTLANATSDIQIGTSPGTSSFFKGAADEVTIYTKALSPAQISTDYTTGISAYGTLTATDSIIPTESLTASESLLKTDTALPTDSLSVVESVLVTGVDIPTEANSVIESLLAQETSNLTDSLVVAESLLATDADVPTESLTASAFGNMQAWGIDALSAMDSLLQTDTALSTESLTVQDSTLMGDVTLPTEALAATESVLATGSELATDALVASETGLVSGTALPTDVLTVNDVVLSTGGSASTEANSASESFLGSGTSQTIESLSTSDALLKADGYVPLESLTTSDNQVSGGVYLPLDGLTGVTSPLEWDIYLPSDDALLVDDSASTMTQDAVGGGLVTTTYSFVDALSVSESLLQTDATLPVESLSIARSITIQGTGILLDSLVVAESLLVADTDLSTDLLTASGFGNMQVWGINALAVIESLLHTSETLPTETLVLRDALLAAHESASSEATSILDTCFLAQGYVPLDTLSASDTSLTGGVYAPSAVLSLLERLLGEDSASWVEDEIAASDSFEGNILPAAVLSSHPLGSSPAFYQGNTVVPTRPSGVYAVNGVILDSQPIICTAPLATSGVRFLAGSTFFLFFERPTTLTQTLLANGQTVSITFALANGQMVTGRVEVASTFVAATSLSVVCTLLSADVALALLA